MITSYSNIISVTTLSNLLLDTYSGAAAAYSLRGLSTEYVNGLTPYAATVRNGTGDAANIGFVFNSLTGEYDLDTAALLAHCNGSNGFVADWYDQSGNGYDATQASAENQPQIVSGGSVILENGKPTIYGLSADFLLFPFPFGLYNVVYDTFAVVKNNPITAGSVLFGSENTADWAFRAQSGSFNPYMFSNSSNDSTHINGTPYTFTNRGDLYNELTSQTLVNVNASYSFAGTSIRNSYNDGTLAGMYISQELIMYPGSQSSNRNGIETNINDFYSIY